MDTLMISKKLIAVGFKQEQAEAVATTIKEEVELKNNELATRSDIALLQKDVKATQKDIKELRWLFGAGFVVIGVGLGYIVSLLNTLISKI